MVTDDNENDNENDDDDCDLPSIEQLLYTTLQKEGFAAEDQRPKNTAFGVGDTTAKESGDSLNNNKSVPGDNSGGSLGEHAPTTLYRGSRRPVSLTQRRRSNYTAGQ
jgi:hypothetical protein